jgi:hypothetical protein
VTDAPEARIRAGSPTPEEEAAILAAIEKIWRDERAKAAAAAGRSRWITAARIEATKRGAVSARGPGAWRLSGFIGSDAATATQIGRGDAR